MAFDMYLAEKAEEISHHEESLLELISEDDDYPTLNWLWEEFYNGPAIRPELANQLVHELIRLKGVLKHDSNNKQFLHTIDRLLPFFSNAYQSNQTIKCMSD